MLIVLNAVQSLNRMTLGLGGNGDARSSAAPSVEEAGELLCHAQSNIPERG
jgi:hypothetical protein